MTETRNAPVMGSRVFWLDNLRTFMIFLVVLLHAGIVYESSGGGAFFWLVDDPSTNKLADILNSLLDIVVMPAIFFVSGFFALFSIRNKSGWSFLKIRFKRLIGPWILGVLTLIPLYKVIFLYSRNIPQENWTSYFHFSNGIISQSWLWFLPVLFMFNILFLFLSKLIIRISKIGLKKAVWAAFLIGLVNLIGMDLFNGEGWTKTILIDFQNERLLIYFMAFLLGSLCNELKTFESKKGGKRFHLVLSFASCLPVVLYIMLSRWSILNPGEYLLSEIADSVLIRLSFSLSLLGLLTVVVNAFLFYANRQGRLGQALNKSSYGIYIIHTIVLGGIALVMLERMIPSALKHLILTVTTFAASHWIVILYRTAVSSIMSTKKRRR